MSDKVETLDDILGPAESLDDILAGPRVELFGQKPMLDYFSEGFKQGFQPDQPFGLGEKDLKQFGDVGLLRKAGEKDLNWIRQFNESLIRPSAEVLGYALRLGQGAVYGFSREAEAYGVPRDLTPAAQLEAFTAGRFTGLPTRPAPGRLPLKLDLDLAVELGEVPGRPTSALAREAFAPEQPVSPIASGDFAPVRAADAQVRPVDLHDVARVYAPEVFERYDALTEQHRALSDTLAEMKANDPVLVAAQSDIDQILGRVNGVESRLTNRAAARLEQARDVLDEAVRRDSPEQNAIRLQRNAIDADLRELAPEVARGYREARDSLTGDGLLAVREETRQSFRVAAKNPDGSVVIGEPGQIHADLVYAEARSEMGFADSAGRFLTREEAFKALTPEAKTTLVVKGELDAADYILRGAPEPRPVVNLTQRAPTIRQQVLSDLRAVGRPSREAEAAAALVAERYAARGERLGIPAQELFDRDFPSIRSGGPSLHRGMYRTATNELFLFEKADASTFIHEMGHRWFKELSDDAALPDAPTDLVRDRDIAREWMKEAGGERAQQEMFARGFERYLMEGVAPSSRLARVFEQFKDWLARIYQSVSRLRAPINDDIRGVYERLISAPNREPVIVGDRVTRNFADTAESFARETPAADAAEAANRVRFDRDRVAEMLSEVVRDARREARRGPERVRVPEPESAGDGPSASGPSPAERAAALSEGRAVPPAKGAEVQPDGSFDKVGGQYVNAAGEINLEALLTADDVVDALRMVVREGGFTEARRAPLSEAETLRLAQELGMNAKNIDMRAVGEAFNAEQITALIDLYRRSGAETRQLMERAAAGDLESIKNYAIARERHLMIMEQMLGARAEAGRALRAIRQLHELKDVEQLDVFLQRTLGKTTEDLKAEAALGTLYLRQDQMANFLQKTQRAPRNPDETMGKTTARKVLDGVMEFWVSSIFSGPGTQVANLLGNFIPLVQNPIELAGAAAVGRLRGTRSVEFSEIGDWLHGYGEGSWRGMIEAGKVLWDENHIDPRFSGAMDHYNRAIPGAVGRAIRAPGLRMLAVGDAFFKSVNHQAAVGQIAHRIAREEGLIGDARTRRISEITADPSEAVQAAAADVARYQTFQKPLGDKGAAFQEFVNQHPISRLIFPTVRTPINLLKYSAERTPFGFLMREVRDKLSGVYGEAAKDMQIARMSLGTMFMGAAVTGWLLDLVTDGGPVKPEEQETWRASGRQPYSWKLGETWVDYRRFSPLGTHFMLATDLAATGAQLGKALDKDDEKEWDRARGMLAASVWTNIGENLGLRGASDLFEAISNYPRHGQNFMEKFAASWVPNLIGQTNDMRDPVLRDAQTVMDKLRIKAGIGREDVAVLRDRWGEPILLTGAPFTRMMTNATDDPVNAEMMRVGANPARPQRKWSGVELTPEQYDDYARIAGRFAKQRLDSFVADPAYRAIPTDGLKLLSIMNVIQDSRDYARDAVKIKYPELIALAVEEKLKELR